VRIAYLVHDLNDAAVKRRVTLFQAAGQTVAVGGFHRDPALPARLGDGAVLSLGRTHDGALARRALAVLGHVAAPATVRRLFADADVIVARNLEQLVIAARARRDGQRLVYECLDIHRLLLGTGAATRALRAAERWAMRHVDLVVVSAPAFRDAYFRDRIGYRGPILLVENLVPRLDDAPVTVIAPPAPPPWVIGWFGMLRCRRSLTMLAAIAAGSGGAIQVVIAGRASPDIFPDFAQDVSAMPGVTYLGGYTAADLPALFGRIHFIWAIDYFEEGLNSTWLLPNRLYEGVAHGAVPVALRSVATGDWIAARGIGAVLDDPAVELPALLAALRAQDYARMREAVAAIPAAAVTMDRAQARAVADAVTGQVTGAGAQA
jgi:succinoglycan biosynthesis protein ExoL